MRLPWARRVRRDEGLRQQQVTERYHEWADSAQQEADGLWAALEGERRKREDLGRYTRGRENRILEVAAERDEALQRAEAAEHEAGRLRMIVAEVREALEAERV